MKIDLHLHSIPSKNNGDSIKWIGDKEVLKLVKRHEYRMISFTDHNVFDWKQYSFMRDYSRGIVTILPGIEVNIITLRGEIGNILFIFKEDLSKEELKKIEKICRVNLKKSGVTHKQALEIFKDFNTIIIPHVGKSDYLTIEDLKLIEYDAFEVTNLSHHNYKKVMKTLGDVSTVAFSDTHIWTSFPQNDKLITDIYLKEYKFIELKKELKKNKNFTKEKYG